MSQCIVCRDRCFSKSFFTVFVCRHVIFRSHKLFVVVCLFVVIVASRNLRLSSSVICDHPCVSLSLLFVVIVASRSLRLSSFVICDHPCFSLSLLFVAIALSCTLLGCLFLWLFFVVSFLSSLLPAVVVCHRLLSGNNIVSFHCTSRRRLSIYVVRRYCSYS